MKYTTIIIVALSVVVGGCASGPRTTTLQIKPTIYSAPSPSQVSELKIEILDRRDNKSMDLILAGPPADTVKEAIKAALKESKVIEVIPGNQPNLEITGVLDQLEWNVPDYDAMRGKAFAVSFLTGGIGGLAYGSTGTPVRGIVRMRVSFARSGTFIMKGEYAGFYEEKLAKLKCDTMETKARIVGFAVSDAVEKLVKDVEKLSATVGRNSKNEPNQAPVPTVMSVTPGADAPVAPVTTAAHL